MDVPIYLDINECLVNNNGCQQNCYNFLGSAVCWCKSGYSLASDQRSCNGEITMKYMAYELCQVYVDGII